ncbi:MAG: polysaccharide deacetylase family protein [Luteibaculaceae bacterium]
MYKKYIIKTPALVERLMPDFLWRLSVEPKEKAVALTFDDGPIPHVTPFVLDTLNAYDIKATFFCIGKNVAENKAVYERILAEGHTVGNHTNHHCNGWKVSLQQYKNEVLEAKSLIQSSLFRPPYGKLTPGIARMLKQEQFSVVMWSGLSLDYDKAISPKKCLENAIQATTGKGDIIVFHDSKKAEVNLRYALPKYIDYCLAQGFSFRTLT